MLVRRASHCTYSIRYHMVFVMRCRKNLITNEIFDFMKIVCSGISKRYYLFFDALGGDGDHIHLVIESAPKYSPSRIMQLCKSILAREIFNEFPDFREVLWGGEFWSDGGHIDTIGDGQGLNKIKDYVENQGNNVDQLNLFQFPNRNTPQLAAK